MKKLAFCASIILLYVPAAARARCDDFAHKSHNTYSELWHDKARACMDVQSHGRYRSEWSLGRDGNMVAGVGWTVGSANRLVTYKAMRFVPGSNGYISLYGWSRDPLVEYYVVDSYGPFTPPGKDAEELGMIQSDGGTYKIYRAQRVKAPSIEGTATFYQYWSVRTVSRPIGSKSHITFANHVRGWEAAGLKLGKLQYQMIATEGFGSTGRSAVQVRLR